MGSKNFKYLDELIHSGVKEIVLDSDIVLDDSEESDYKDGIKLDVDDLVIEGNGYEIDACGKTRIFYCTGKNIKIKNTIFKRGFNIDGGAIWITESSNLEINNCTFKENTAQDDCGAIANFGKITINNSHFTENTTKKGNGGAIYNQEGEISINNCNFNENTAQTGGAIINWGKITIADTDFTKNTANGEYGVGGAIYNNNGELIVSGSVFTENTAYMGGAISNDIGGRLSVSDSTLTENTAENDGGAICNSGELTINKSTLQGNTAGQGGAIRNRYGSVLTINKSTLQGNTAKENGGAIDNSDDGELTVSESTLTENTAERDGGAIYNKGELTVSESTLTENTAERGGGAIDNSDGGELTVSESTLTENTANGEYGVGGAIHNTGELTVSDSTLTGNTAQKDGGAIRNRYGSVLTINKSTLQGNTAKENGGAIYNKGELTVSESTLQGNTAERGGGAIYNKNNEVNVNGCSFDLNTSNKEYSQDIYNDGKLTLNGTYFTNMDKSILNYQFTYLNDDEIKEKIHNQGTIFKPLTENEKSFSYLNQLIRENPSKVMLNDDITLDWYNEEESIFPDGIMLGIDNITIDGNGHTIDACGKTRLFKCTGKNITIKNITLKNGHANLGGAIHNRNGELTITESTLQGNTAQKRGGAIFNYDGELTITESTLTENTANGEYGVGGAIHNTGELAVSDSTLTGNTAQKDGGAIHNYKGELTITESTLQGNTAQDGSGGAIFNYDGELTITESTLQGNTAQEGSGGAIRNSGELTINKSTLQGNTSHDGGAIFNDYHGAIFNDYGGELTVKDSTLTENTAENYGGAILNKHGHFKVFNCDFSNNESRKAIVMNWDSLQFFNSNFIGNGALNVIINWSKLSISNGKFKDNVGDSIIFNEGKLCTIEKSIFENNNSYSPYTILNESDLILINPKINDEDKIFNDGYVLIKKSADELEDKIFGDGKVENESKYEFKKFDFTYLDKKIHESKTKEIMLEEDISFENYETDYYEGGIELDIDNLIIDGKGHTIDAKEKTRIFYCTGKNITIKNLILKNGYSHKNYDNPFNNNGGAIRINHDTNLTIENCKFINNISEESSGAIHNRRSVLTITESTFNENIAKRYFGGAIYNDKGMLTVRDSTLNENTAENFGGAIYNNNGELIVSGSVFTENTAHMGGAISNDKGGRLSVSDSTLTENTAENDGGAICNSGELTINKSTLQGNTAGQGGAIRNTGELTITESTLTENTAQDGGGAIDNWIGKYESNNCTFKDNKPDDV